MATHPVFLSGESRGQRSLADYSPGGSQSVRHDWSNWACTHKTQRQASVESWDQTDKQVQVTSGLCERSLGAQIFIYNYLYNLYLYYCRLLFIDFIDVIYACAGHCPRPWGQRLRSPWSVNRIQPWSTSRPWGRASDLPDRRSAVVASRPTPWDRVSPPGPIPGVRVGGTELYPAPSQQGTPAIHIGVKWWAGLGRGSDS